MTYWKKGKEKVPCATTLLNRANDFEVIPKIFRPSSLIAHRTLSIKQDQTSISIAMADKRLLLEFLKAQDALRE